MTFLSCGNRAWLLTVALLVAVRCWAADPPRLRLDDRAAPLRYAVELTVDPAQDVFEGRLVIDLKFSRQTRLLWLNATSLTIKEAQLTHRGVATAVTIQPGDEHTVGFAFEAPVPAGKAQLAIDYAGTINAKTTAGVFKVEEGDEWYVLTDFEPFDARRAFPSFDEPNHKTPWQLTLRVPEGLAAFANTPLERESRTENGLRIFEFRQSQPLPTYLVAFAVGPFETVEARKSGRNETPVRIITPRGKASQAEYAAQVTPEILEWLEDYFGLPYPYDKLDSIAIPVGFGFGAMENAGLVTYIQPLLLADPKKDSITRQRSYYSTCAHELAHQWFGNLVTPVWWDDIWLNEAFATWMGGKLMESQRPEWNPDLSSVNSRLGVMRQDRLISARSIRNPIHSYDDVMSAFDGITYSKGKAVIRMFEAWVGEDAFRRGVRRYIKQWAWGNASSRDFLDALSSEARPDVSAAFTTFLRQGGAPLVSVSLQCQEGRKPTVRLRQKRALPVGSQGSEDQIWRIPVCVRYESNGNPERDCFLLADAAAEWELKTAESCPAWLSPNAHGEGYYHVDYEEGLLEPLLADGGMRLPATERVSVAGDVLAGFEMGTLLASSALGLVPKLAGDDERAVVDTTLRIAGRIWPHMVGEDLRPHYARFLRDAYAERAHKLGWAPDESDDAETRLLRTRFAFLMATRGEDEMLAAQARGLLDQWIKDRTAVAPEMVTSVLAAAVYHGGRDLFEQLLAALERVSDRRERQQLYRALGGFRDREIAEDALALLLDEQHDFRESIGVMWASHTTMEIRELRFDFVREHFDELIERLPAQGGFAFGAQLPGVGTVFCSEEKARELEEFFGERVKKFHGGEHRLSEVLESVRLCTSLKEAQKADVAAFLRKY